MIADSKKPDFARAFLCLIDSDRYLLSEANTLIKAQRIVASAFEATESLDIVGWIIIHQAQSVAAISGGL
ncbi:hypothetical protein BST96_08620 [Oceanicoccus sagamiensis]|uniref:Uncharacterized protein n=1 Tax=Oceanicoccus sagamiensis TaxID=716816 RepID=A0A1X9N928_9GAMM|nr:hypothetical protein BST96_08620 [Oceanicoccus sagamiensis]